MPKFASEIREQAFALGIDKLGIAPATVLEGEGRRLKEWLGLGFHGEMSWMARGPEKRADPGLIFPGARTVVVAAVNYYTEHEHTAGTAKGRSLVTPGATTITTLSVKNSRSFWNSSDQKIHPPKERSASTRHR